MIGPAVAPLPSRGTLVRRPAAAAILRALCLLAAGGFGLLLVSCGSAKVPPTNIPSVARYKEMLPGKWHADSQGQLIQAYEFGSDDKVTATVPGMKEPVRGRYRWTADRDLELEYQAPDEVKKEYATAVKAYKQRQDEAAGGGQFGAGERRAARHWVRGATEGATWTPFGRRGGYNVATVTFRRCPGVFSCAVTLRSRYF